MLAVLFGALAGALFGALAVAVRLGLRRGADPEVGAVVVAGVGARRRRTCWRSRPSSREDVARRRPLAVRCRRRARARRARRSSSSCAVRDAGPSRAAILIGTAPLMSVAIALVVLDEPFRPVLLVGTALVVAGGAALARERARPEHFQALGAVFALVCAALFAVRDNVARWAARDAHPPAARRDGRLAARRVPGRRRLRRSSARRDALRTRLRPALPAFAPAGRRARTRLRLPARGVRPRARLDRRPAERDPVALGGRLRGAR